MTVRSIYIGLCTTLRPRFMHEVFSSSNHPSSASPICAKVLAPHDSDCVVLTINAQLNASLYTETPSVRRSSTPM